MKRSTLLRAACAAAVGLACASAALVAQEKAGGGEQVVLEIKRPKMGYIGTPKEPPKGARLDPKWRPGKHPEVMVPKGAVNLASKRPATSSDMEPIVGSLEQVTDGDKEASEGSWVELGPGKQWVQVDLGAPAAIYALAVWHVHSQPVVYKDVVVQVSDDKDFVEGVRTVFNNDADNTSGHGIGEDFEYFEGYEGKLIDARGVRGRYVRLWSNGNTTNEQNHYTEVEVYGVPAK
jgi:hypothetical protein